MRTRTVLSVFCLAFVVSALPAQAQFESRSASDRATGENYRIEIAGFLWNPTPDMAIQSEALGIIGSRIDLIEDLGLEKARFNQLKVVLRPATKHKLRFEYTPIRYEQPNGTLRRTIIFNGIAYDVALPVATTVRWNAYRFAYEYDIIYRDRGFLGLVLEAKYTDVEATVANFLNTEFVRARAPIPALGAIARVYVAPNISITGEFGGFKLPESIDENYQGRYFDYDVYGSVNLTDHFGAQVGYRSLDVFYRVDDDQGELKLKGLYFGGAVRF